MKQFWRKIWNGWKRFARILGAVQAEIILFLFYFLIFVPFGLILKLFGFDPLHIRRRKTGNWQTAEIGAFDPEKGTHQS
jgi:hypothetical protein